MSGMRSRDGGFKLPSLGKFNSIKLQWPKPDKKPDAGWAKAEAYVNSVMSDSQAAAPRPRDASGRFVASQASGQRPLGSVPGNFPSWMLQAKPLTLLGL